VTSAAGRVAAVGLRARIAGRAALYVGSVSRHLRLGGGSVIGGRVGLVLDPGILDELARGRTVALVSGTNGKTTTTRLLAAALGGPGRVATSSAGANLPSGLVTALAGSPAGSPAVLEVDEGYVAAVADAVRPAAIALLNLSRDQLDRMSEVRMVADRWRRALDGREGTVVVANADDPLVAWAAGGAPRVLWVAAGQLWHADSVGCPACEGRIVFEEADGGSTWSCSCGFRRPVADAWLEGEGLVTRDGLRLALALSLPGRCNRANAAIAVVTARALGVDATEALGAMERVEDVEGRFATLEFEGTAVRLLLAKNPAGWTELLDLLQERSRPVVIGINARIADGHDPSWLWDVPFDLLSGRPVVATGERCLDLAVRLRHAEVEHLVVRDQLDALRTARAPELDYVGNYTAFQQLRRALGAGARSSSDGAPRRRLPRRQSTESVRVKDVGAPRGEAGSPPDGVSTAPRRDAGDGVSALRVVVVHPDLLGTYGDGGNGLVLLDRARWRGMRAELLMATSDAALPEGADIYCLGGGEDGPQVQSAQLLVEGALQRAVDAGAAVLAVCAGYQVLGRSFPDAKGATREGVGLLDVATRKGPSRRAVGELLSEPLDERLGQLTGFENHAGVTSLGGGVRPLGRVVSGIGNGAGDRTEGAVSGRVVGTYMHGPVLARNPSLADLLLEMVTGTDLSALEDEEEEALRTERLNAVGARGPMWGLSKLVSSSGRSA